MAKPRVGLVLGGGGVVGGAFHAGVLAALAEFAGWDARKSDIVVGTSAGSLTASFLRAGFPPIDLAARARGEQVSEEGARVLERIGPMPETPTFSASMGFGASRRTAATRSLEWSALRPWRVRPGAAIAALLPPGKTPSEPIRRLVDPLYSKGWPMEPLWIPAVGLDNARRVVFGREGGPEASVGQAVAASCAIPGFFEPVPISDGTYVDGGAHSPTNLDVLRREALDLVIVSSPMSVAGRQWRLSVDLPFRRICRVRLAAEAASVRRRGTSVVTFQPHAEDLKAMGLNAMDPGRRAPVVAQAHDSTRRRLEQPALRERLASIL